MLQWGRDGMILCCGTLLADCLQAAETLAESLEQRVLDKYDTDKDGNITTEEALAVDQAIVDAKIAEILQKFDLDHDGNITTVEIQSALQSTRWGGGGTWGH